MIVHAAFFVVKNYWKYEEMQVWLAGRHFCGGMVGDHRFTAALGSSAHEDLWRPIP